MNQQLSQSPRIVFLGTGPFAAPAMEALAQAYGLVSVVTQPDRPMGRGRRVRRGLIAACADASGVPVAQPESLRDDSSLAELQRLNADLLIVASYGKRLPDRVLRLPSRGTLNLHPSLLPRHRGPSPIPGAILAGDTVTGVSVMEMIREMDAGPIVAQRRAPVLPVDTTASLTERLAVENAELLLDALPPWLRGDVTPVPQDEGRATYTSILTKEMGRLDWFKPAVQLEREVRAYQPWPVAWTPWPEGLLKVFRAAVVEGTPSAGAPSLPGRRRPGRVAGLEANGLLVETGAGLLRVTEVQTEGARRMPVAEFVRGHPAIRDAVLG